MKIQFMERSAHKLLSEFVPAFYKKCITYMF